MKSSFLYLLAINVLVLPAAGAPVIIGLHGKHGLPPAKVGQVLVEELRCGACHDGFSKNAMKGAPDLARAANRIHPEFIARMIENPAEAHPGTTMPQMLTAESSKERKEIAESITAFLRSLSGDGLTETRNAEADAKKGKELFHEVGCVACHSPRNEADLETDTEGVVRLDHLNRKFTEPSLSMFLLDPIKARPSGRMPDMQLTPDEAGHVAAYLTQTSAKVGGRAKPTARLVRAGKELFQALNCAACHPLEGIRAGQSAPPRSTLDQSRGCLDDSPGSAPDFSLSPNQRESIRAFLSQPRDIDTNANGQIAVALAKFNCIACHERDEYGGNSPDRDAWFHTSEEGLGNDARIPPPLTLAGAKLRNEWLSQVLLEGRTVRPYMRTRMPQFGPAVGGLPSLFAKADSMEPVELREPSRNERRVFRDEARKLLGDRGLNCVACHNFNGKDSPGFKGLDLMTTFQRLQPAWFVTYLKDPATFRPGTIMPNFWPDGQAVHTGILDGDTEKQMRAIWHYFSLGHSAPDPSGIRTEPTALRVQDRPRTYRGRNAAAGYRGIAVGFPGGLNYSFNAEYGTLVAVWRGDFVNVNWRGQAAGNFNPAGRETVLARDVSLTRLENESTPWPLRPLMTKENPLNPDPLYPRNQGYAFRGYAMDEDEVPTFLYAIEDIAVKDRTIAKEQDGVQKLTRTLTFSSPAPTTLYFRVSAGRIEARPNDDFQFGKLRVSPESGKTILRPSTENPDEKELLVKLSLAQGETDFRLNYELNE